MPDCSAVARSEPKTSRQRMPPTCNAAIVASSAPMAAPSVGVKSERPTKKSPFMPTNTTRKMAITGQVSPTCRRRLGEGAALGGGTGVGIGQ